MNDKRYDPYRNAGKYNCRHPYVVKRLNRFFKTVTGLLARVDSQSVLSLGCGEGMDLQRINGLSPQSLKRCLGLDVNLGALQVSRKILEGAPYEAVCGDVGSLPLRLERFDTILGLEVLEHLKRPELILEELAVRFRGHCLFSVPNEPWYRLTRMVLFGQNIASLGNHPDHINRWSSKGFERLMRKYFTVMKVEKPFPWVLVLCKTRKRNENPIFPQR